MLSLGGVPMTTKASNGRRSGDHVREGDYSPRVNIHGRWKDIPLPEDWAISETIQGKSYRNPWRTASKNLLRVRRVEKPADNIVPSEKERKILRVRTGESEYEATIAATGNKIIEEKPIGEPLPIDPKIYMKGSNISVPECLT
ncbi:uncharacterized protein LOC143174607 [Nomia melanderi]|uniref:uncharacterized protein LOC143174607 n=1 Tax=Nomia melanderi TaxID=2448451 RepID=UPI003FCC45B7